MKFGRLFSVLVLACFCSACPKNGPKPSVQLKWEPPVSTPEPITVYVVSRAPSTVGPFTKVATVAGTTYTDTSVSVAQTVCYDLAAMGADGVLSSVVGPLCFEIP